MAVRAAPQRPGRVLRPEALPAPRPHLQVVPPDYVTGRARQRRARRLVVLGGVALAALLFGVVAFHVVLTQSQLNIQHLETRAQAASLRQQQLRLEAARLESPERVVDDAKALGMVPPTSVRYLTPSSEATSAPPLTTPVTAKAPAAPAKVSAAPKRSAPPVAATPRVTTAPAKTAAAPAGRVPPPQPHTTPTTAKR